MISPLMVSILEWTAVSWQDKLSFIVTTTLFRDVLVIPHTLVVVYAMIYRIRLITDWKIIKMQPTYEYQIQFLQNLQRILWERVFTSIYRKAMSHL